MDNKEKCGKLVLDRVSDGNRSCGFTWHLEEEGIAGVGIRGTTFISLNEDGRIVYLREICEPLFKPGDQTVQLLKAMSGNNAATFDKTPLQLRTPKGAGDVCRYLWEEIQGKASTDEIVTLFAEDVVYEDFNYEEPMRGKAEVRDFLRTFMDIKAIKFVPERYTDGELSCCFTWHIEIAGLPDDAPKVRGISFYELDSAGKISYVRDVPESVLKPPPLQAAATFVRPQLRTFQPRSRSILAGVKASEPPCNCAQGGGIVWPTGEFVEGPTLLAQQVTNTNGELVRLGDQQGNAEGSVVLFLRHFG